MKSMTGYGTAEGRVGRGLLFIEIKTVNHRFNEFNIKIPPKMGVLEAHIRKHLTPLFSRGKVDVFFKEKEHLFGDMSIIIDTALARRYQKSIKKIKKELKLHGQEDLLSLVGLDRILRVEEKAGSYEHLWGQIAGLLNSAASQVSNMRSKEGAHILDDQRRRLKKVGGLIKRIRHLASKAQDKNIARIRKRLYGEGTTPPAEEQRLQMEAAYIGGRQDIMEELVRLESHTKQYVELLHQREPVGRKLDFLLQEMNREVNTVGAKAADAPISQIVINCKSEFERLREQVQNVE